MRQISNSMTISLPRQAASGIYFQVLGPVTAKVGEEEIPLGPQQRALLAALLVARGKMVPRKQLTETLWAESDPSGRSITLRTHILHLRRLLEPHSRAASPYQIIVTSNIRHKGGYSIDVTSSDVDSVRFTDLLDRARRLAGDDRLDAAAACLGEALDLWRGPAFADLAERNFVAGEARRLEELRRGAQERRVELLLALGRHRDAVPHLTALLDEHRLNETHWGQFMLALYRSGRRAEALAAYRDVYTLLQAELGMEPGPQLRRLHQQVLSADPALEVARHRAVFGS